MSSSVQRKRRTSGGSVTSRTNTKTRGGGGARRMANANRRAIASRAASIAPPRGGVSDADPPPPTDTLDMTPPPTETIDVMDNTEDNVCPGVEEVVDLTCDVSEAAVVDLTNNDSVLLVDEGPRTRRVRTSESYVVSSDEEDAAPVLNSAAVSTVQSNSTARWTPGTISCPVCLDSYTELMDSGRLVVSTRCGHVFCSQCLRDALSRSHTCPTCRKRLGPRQYHPLYI